jgi:hypothetical protein
MIRSRFILTVTIVGLASCAKQERPTTTDTLVTSTTSSAMDSTVGSSPVANVPIEQPAATGDGTRVEDTAKPYTSIPSSEGTRRQKPSPPSGTTLPVHEANIRVTTPRPGSTAHADQFVLEGQARTFENMVAYRLSLENGRVLSEGHVQAKGPMGVFSSFRTMVKAGQKGKAVLEVFQNSAKDGSEIDKVRIPLILGVGAND